MRISIIGCGAWGTALGIVLADAGAKVTLITRNAAVLNDINVNGRNHKYLPEVQLSGKLCADSRIGGAEMSAGMLVIAVPFQHARQVLREINTRKQDIDGVVWASKGIELASYALAHEIVAAELGSEVPFAILSGPNFAAEVARKLPAAVTIASSNKQFLDLACSAFHTNYFRPYSSDDVTGVEVGGAVKNVVAIAAGIADGLKLGANARAALITRGLAEIARWGSHRGGRQETFMGLSGLGDLVLTCTDDMSRNRRFGLALASGKTIDDAAKIVGLVEGVKTAVALAEVCLKDGVEMPIASHVAMLVQGEISPQQAVGALMSRELSAESYGSTS